MKEMMYLAGMLYSWMSIHKENWMKVLIIQTCCCFTCCKMTCHVCVTKQKLIWIYLKVCCHLSPVSKHVVFPEVAWCNCVHTQHTVSVCNLIIIQISFCLVTQNDIIIIQTPGKSPTCFETMYRWHHTFEYDWSCCLVMLCEVIL